MFIKIMTVQVLARGMGVKTAAWPDSEIADQLSYCRTAWVVGGAGTGAIYCISQMFYGCSVR